MGIVKDRFRQKADAMAAEIKELLKEHGNKKIGEVQLSQVYQGAGWDPFSRVFHSRTSAKITKSNRRLGTFAGRIVLFDAGGRTSHG
jgi:hypothetical protein